MKRYRPLLIEDLGLAMPGVEVMRLRLNEHLLESRPEEHSHAFAQVLVYLRGEGAQTVGGRRFWAKAGSVVFIPEGEPHQFERTRRRRPLCLVLDVRVAELVRQPRIRGIPAAGLAIVRRRVSDLLAVRGGSVLDRRLRVGSAILDILAVVFHDGAGNQGERGARSVSRRAERAIIDQLQAGEGGSLAGLALELGYQRDHLNRILKRESGLTLGQLRAQVRLGEAKRLLGQQLAIGDVGSRVGFDDQNYFARWFRVQTGLTPSSWRTKQLGAIA